jgi:hypothetical protein
MATNKTSLDLRFRLFIQGIVGVDPELGSSGNEISDEQTFDANERLDFGTADGQANQWWYDRRILDAAQTDSHDLSGGLTTPEGHSIVGLVLKGIFLHNRSDETLTLAEHGVTHTANAAKLELTRPAANGVPWLKAAGDAIPMNAGGFNGWYDPVGVTITAATGDLVDIVETATLEAAYDIVFVIEE